MKFESRLVHDGRLTDEDDRGLPFLVVTARKAESNWRFRAGVPVMQE
jgi:hypothetical protein